MAEYRKVKDMRMGYKTKPEKTEKQLESSRESGLKVMLIKNPMRNPKSIEKHRKSIPRGLEKRKNNPNYKRILFQPENELGMKNKGKKHTKEQNIKQSMNMTARKINPKSKEALIRFLIHKGPVMKNPEMAKRNAEARSLQLPKEVLEKAVQDFYAKKSITQIAKEIKVDRIALGKLLRKNGVVINAEERNKLDYPLKKKTQFKAGQKPIYGFKKGNIPWNKKTQEEVKQNEEDNSIAVTALNPAVIVN